MTDKKTLSVIGRAEKVFFPELLKDTPIPAKVDTGADLSSIWASDIQVKSGTLSFRLFEKGAPLYTGESVSVEEGSYRLTRVANSFGNKEYRYVVKLKVKLAGRTVRASFTLANRGNKLYPVLLGRRLVKGKFLVDVSQGDALHAEEKMRKAQLAVELKKMNGKLRK